MSEKSRLNEEEKRNSVLRQLALIRNMDMEELRKEWKNLYGTDAPEYQKPFLLKKLAYRIQELHYGGLSERSLSILRSDSDRTIPSGAQPQRKTGTGIFPGTRFVRVYNERTHEVIARESGFEYDGIIYKSLTAVAEKITGSHWNGKAFFGVNRKK